MSPLLTVAVFSPCIHKNTQVCQLILYNAIFYLQAESCLFCFLFFFLNTIIRRPMFVHFEGKGFILRLFPCCSHSFKLWTKLSEHKSQPHSESSFYWQTEEGGLRGHISSELRTVLNTDIPIPLSKSCKCLKADHELENTRKKKSLFPIRRQIIGGVKNWRRCGPR